MNDEFMPGFYFCFMHLFRTKIVKVIILYIKCPELGTNINFIRTYYYFKDMVKAYELIVIRVYE
jgi:hypothetical protein